MKLEKVKQRLNSYPLQGMMLVKKYLSVVLKVKEQFTYYKIVIEFQPQAYHCYTNPNSKTEDFL